MRRMCYHFFQQLNTLTLKFYIFISSMHPCFEANLWDWRISLSVCDCVYLLVFVWMFSCVYFLVCRQILDTLVICEILMVLFVSYGSLLTSQTHTHTSPNTDAVAHLQTVRTDTWIRFSLPPLICLNLAHLHKASKKPSVLFSSTDTCRLKPLCNWLLMKEVTDSPPFIKVKLSCGIRSPAANVVVCCDLSSQTDLLDVPRKQTPWCRQTPSCSPGEEGRRPGPCWIRDASLINTCCAPWERGNSRAASTPWLAGSPGFSCSSPDREEGDERMSGWDTKSQVDKSNWWTDVGVQAVPAGWCHTRSWSRASATLTWEPPGSSFRPSAGWAHGGLSAGCHCLQTEEGRGSEWKSHNINSETNLERLVIY